MLSTVGPFPLAVVRTPPASLVVLPSARRLIRPPDPAIHSTTLSHMRMRSDEAVRRLVHLAFRDARTAIDLTYAAKAFWRDPVPPGLIVTSNDWDAASGADLHLDFTATGLDDGSFDLVVYDPPHIADGGEGGILTARYGTIKTTAALRALIVAGAAEAWRLATVGVLVKVTDHSHGSVQVEESDWIKDAVPMPLYTKLHTFKRVAMLDVKHRAERVPRNNGSTYMVFRKSGPQHRDFDELYRRQRMSHIETFYYDRRCPMCDIPLPDARRRDAGLCSARCRKRAERRRQTGG